MKIIAGGAGLACLLVILWPGSGLAQSLSVDLGDRGSFTARVIQLSALITLIALTPALLIVATSFTRIIVVLSLLRTAIGLQTAPPNIALVSLAVFLTGFIMAPVFEQVYSDGIRPYMEEQIPEEEAFAKSVAPLEEFMHTHTRRQDIDLFMEIGNIRDETVPLHVLLPSFMLSELRRAFEIGFLIYLPFVVIDLVVSAVLMSMGMMMLPPVAISLPFKLIFFVVVDGWRMVAESLVRSYWS